YNDPLTATDTYKERYIRPLSNEGDIYVGSPWKMGKTYVLEHLTISDDVNLLVLSTRHFYSNAVTIRLNLKSYCDINGNINRPDHKRVVCQIVSLHRITNNCKYGKKCKYPPIQYDLWLDEIVSIIAQAQNHLADWAKKMSSLSFESWKSASLICHLRKDVQGIVHALKTDFPELQIKEYHSKSDPEEKARDFSNVEELWKDLDLIAYTSTLKIGVLCTNPKFEWAFCLFNSFIETNARTNQMLFQCLSQELQNRGIFSDIDSIIQNKDVPTIRLWASMIVSVIEFIPKPEDTTILLFQTVKVNSSIVKAEEISDISNAFI
ncbi:4276_t:CDS:2, partial [Funneliformis geosporum]